MPLEDLDEAISLIRQCHIAVRNGYLDLKKSEYIAVMNKLKSSYNIMFNNYSQIWSNSNDFAKELEKNDFNVKQKIDNIFDVFFPHYRQRTRKRGIVLARHVYYYFLRKYTALSLQDIGGEFEQDHTTVIHALANVQKLIDSQDSQVLSMIKVVDSGINSTDDIQKL